MCGRAGRYIGRRNRGDDVDRHGAQDRGSAAIIVVAIGVAWCLAMASVVAPLTRHLAAVQHAQSAADAAALAAVLEDCGAASRLAAANEAVLVSCERGPATFGIGAVAIVQIAFGDVSATARASTGA